MNKFFKRLALLLAVLMIVSMMPVQLFADNSVITYVNNGTENGEDGTTTTEVASYVTVELEFGSNVSAEDIAAAKALYEGKKFDTCKAANEAYMALFGVTWGKGYLDVTDNSAPLYKYAGVSGSVAEVKYYIHGTLAGFTSLQSNYNNIDCTVGGNHQIARTSISIIGVNDENGGKAKLTDGNIQAYVAGGYISSFTASGKLTIDNIEFTSTTSTTVGASAAKDANSTQEVTSAEMEIKNCKFNGRLYVYDNFDNAGVMTYYIHDNVFDGANYNGDSNAYAIFAQCKGGNKLIIADNKISGFARGINIDHANVNATISGNTISIKDAGRSCIQLSSLTSTVISNNTLELTGGNAITLHEKLLTMTTAPAITVNGNTITGNGYLIYDDAAANNKAFTSENLKLTIRTNTVASTVDTEQGVKGSNKYVISEVVKKALTPAYVAKVNGVDYASLAKAIAEATPDANGVIIYEIYGKATVDSTGWIQVARADLTGLTKVEFVGKTSDAEICITGGLAILADQKYDIDVSFEALTLSKPNPTYGGDYGHSTNYFTTWLRNTNAAENTVTYTNCTFPNGACNNQYGKTVFDGCKFTNATSGKYNFWNYGGNTEIKNSTFTGVRGIKTYNEGTLAVAPTVKIENTTFDGLTEKAAIVTSKATDIALDNVSATNCTEGFFQKDIEYSGEKTTIEANGSAISGNFNITAEKGAAAAKEEFNISGGTFTSEVSSDYLADGFELKKNIDGTYGVKTAGAVEVWATYSGPKVASYDTIAEAVANLGKNNWIVITKDYTLTDDFVIPAGVYLDIEKGATLTVADGVTLTVAADCKRLGVRTGATLINNGTVLVCGTDYSNGKVLVQDNSTIDLNKLTVPTGYFLDNNATNYFASIAIFEITYSDGSTKPASANTSWKNAVKVTLLTDVADFGGNNSVVAKNFVLDLGGFTLSGKTTASSEVLSISVPMTITNGTIKYVSSNTGYGALKTSADVTIDSNATIDGGVGYAIWTDGYDGHTLTVNGTVKSDGSYAITSNGSENGGIIADCSIIVNDSAKIEAPNGIGIYHPELGTVTVNGGEITAHTGIEMCAGKLVVKGGKITSTGANWDATGSQNAILDGAAVSIINRNYPGGIPTAEISGGEFKATGKDAQTIKAYDYKNNTVAEWTNVGESVSVSGGTFSSIPANMDKLCAEGFIPTKNADGTYGVQKATKGSKNYPYTLAELSVMTRADYIKAQKALGGTMYVEIDEIDNYSYGTNGVLGNGVRNDTPGQTPDHSKLNSYGENGYLGANNDGANGKNIIFVGGSITSGVEGYTSIDNIGTSLLLAVPAYTNVTFEGVTFKNVISFDYQLYTSPWSQLGELKFSGCTFNGIIVGAIAAQTLTFDGCEFKNYTNKISANNSNPTWIRPAYGNWSKGDNDGQGSDFKSLTTINFTGNTVTSTRPVKFEYISQWDITSTVTATGNYFDITAQSGDTPIKNVGLYLGAHTDANEFHLVAADNTKSKNTAALYTIPSGKTSLPVDSTVKNTAGESIELTDALKWKATDAEKDKIVLKTVIAVASIGERRFATLEEAVAAVAKNGDTITLLSDVELSSTIVIKDVMNVTLDLNGKKLSTTTKTGDATRHYYAIDNYGTFTLRDSSAEQSGEIRARGIENLGTGTMTIESGKIVAIDANGGAAIWNNANLTINGGTFVAEHVGASSDQYGPGCVYNNGTLTINGGTFTSANKRTYAIVSKAGTVTITPADGKNVTISGAHGGLGIDGGTAIINGGSYASSDYYGLYVSNDAGTADVTVNGGTFTGKKYSVLIGSDGSSSVTSTLKIKGGTFDMPIHAQENTIDGTIAISGGKFKFKVDDKYFDGDHACSTDTTDGYYTVAGHPIISAGLTISADMSFRVKVRSGYENGSLRYYYDTIGENNTIVRVEGEGILGATDADGNSIFRIYNVNPQRADLVYTFQYYDAEGNAVGTPKQRSVIAYFEDFYNLPLGDNEDLDAKKTFIANFLEYCASAMERSYDLHKDVTLNGKTWQDRANAVREMMTHLGVVATDYEFKGNLGRYYSDNVNGVIIERGVAFGSTFKVYYAFSKATIDNGYRVFRQGMDVTDKLELVDGAYRLYFELAPYEFKDNLTITVNNGTTKVCEYTSPLANTLEVLSKSADASVSKMAKAAFNYFVALQNYNG